MLVVLLEFALGQDRQVRIWDLRANKSEGVLDAPSQCCVAFDQQVRPPAKSASRSAHLVVLPHIVCGVT